MTLRNNTWVEIGRQHQIYGDDPAVGESHLFLWDGFGVVSRGGSSALKNLKISVPTAVIRGDDALLECFYELETDQLYAVKWYLHTTEFYRYTPKEIPPGKQFQTVNGGPVVREHLSDGNRVVLAHVSRGNSGKYTCEVTADQPSFFTIMKWSYLQVVDLPKKEPYISGLKTRYRPTDILQANCTSEDANPAANLTWYINGKLVDPVHVHNYRHRESPDGQFYTAHSSLRLKITKHLHSKGSLKIRCVASMYNIYYKVNERSVEWEKKRHRQNHAFAFTSSTSEAPYEHWELVQAPGNHPPTTREFATPSSSTSSKLHVASSLIFAFLLLR